MTTLGTQFILTLEGCPHPYVNDPDEIARTITDVTQAGGLSIVKSVEHRFEPYGLTLMLLLSQSHLIVHTWPEYSTMIVDVFVCVPDFDIQRFAALLLEVTGAQSVQQQVVTFSTQTELLELPRKA